MPRGRTNEEVVRKLDELCDALKECMPLTYACDLVGLPRQTVYDWIKRDDKVRAKIEVAKAAAIKRLVTGTEKQGGSWKLLKNLGRDEFKEHVEVEEKHTATIVLDTGDEKKEYKA